jgi:alkylation response protein AidB-like acyl-CoA dehydrogenase
VDFEYHDTPKQAQFRTKVSAAFIQWKNQPTTDNTEPLEAQLLALMGTNGWLASSASEEALDSENYAVLLDELQSLHIGNIVDQTKNQIASNDAFSEWATAEQETVYGENLSAGQLKVWKLQIESGIKPDASVVHITVARDGDDYILNGFGIFNGIGVWPDLIYALAKTEINNPLAEVTSAFMIPGNLDGVMIALPNVLIEDGAHSIQFDQVRVPAQCILGDDDQGWQIHNDRIRDELLEMPPQVSPAVDDLLEYAKVTQREGDYLSKQSFLQQLLVECYINRSVERLLKVRDQWLIKSGAPITYQAAQTELWAKKTAMRLSQIIRETMGMYAMLTAEDGQSSLAGRLETEQRRSLAAQNPAGIPEVQADLIAKALELDKRIEPRYRYGSQDSPPSKTKI